MSQNLIIPPRTDGGPRSASVLIAGLAAILCSACAADTGRLQTASVVTPPARSTSPRPSAVTKVAVKPMAVPANSDADKAGYCGRWWKHRANNTLPDHVKPGTSDVAHNDTYCDGHR